MPYYAVFATPLASSFRPIRQGSEYSAELDATTDEAAMDEAERHFEPFLLAVHHYETRERKPDQGRTVIDYEDEAITKIREKEALGDDV